jgi:hypothetical protein
VNVNRKAVSVSLCLAVAAFLAGCGATMNTSYRSESTDNLKAISVDAKQRFVFIKTKPDGTHSIVCPEPSPDALSAGSISVSVDASKAQLADLKAAIASAEQAASIGLRTQSISLLRDQLAYMCLLRMADSRDGAHLDQYSLLFKRYQSAVLGVLAIEQLTGAVKAPAVTVSASGTAAVNVDAADKIDTTVSPAPVTDSAPPESGKPVAGKTTETDTTKGVDATKSKVLKVAPVKAGSVSNTGSGGPVSKPNVKGITAASSTGEAAKSVVSPGVSNSDMAVVAQTVFNIVELIVTKSFHFENCYASSSTAAADICKVKEVVEQCVRVTNDESECVKEGVASNVAREIERGLSEVQAKAKTARLLANVYSAPIPDDIPFEAINFGIFTCSGASNDFAHELRRSLVAKGVPSNSITVRSNQSYEDLRAKGFDLSKGGQIIFDDGVLSEEKESETLLGIANGVAKKFGPGVNFARYKNTKAATPLYLSVMFCPQSSKQ